MIGLFLSFEDEIKKGKDRENNEEEKAKELQILGEIDDDEAGFALRQSPRIVPEIGVAMGKLRQERSGEESGNSN